MGWWGRGEDVGVRVSWLGESYVTGETTTPIDSAIHPSPAHLTFAPRTSPSSITTCLAPSTPPSSRLTRSSATSSASGPHVDFASRSMVPEDTHATSGILSDTIHTTVPQRSQKFCERLLGTRIARCEVAQQLRAAGNEEEGLGEGLGL